MLLEQQKEHQACWSTATTITKCLLMGSGL